MSGLRDYLTRKLDAMKAFGAEQPTDAAERKQHLTATVTAEGLTGIRRIKARDFQIITDTGPALAGHDLGARAPEVLLGALGSCVSHTVLIQAALQGINIDELVVEASLDVDSLAGHTDIVNPVSGISYTIRIESDATPEQLRAMNEALPAICPVLNIVQFAQPVSTSIVLNGATL
jgi:uncharacterized OsmC-like protein